MTKISKFIICTFLLLLVISCEKNKPYSNIKLPVHLKAENIKREFSEFPEGKLVQYQIKIEFPANEVIEFYDKALSKLGYKIIPYNPESDRKWTLFSQEHFKFVEVQNKPAHYSSNWADKDHINQIAVTLNYPDPNSNILYAMCGIQPYFDIQKLLVFYKKLDQIGEGTAFRNLLKKYLNKDQSTNMKKALKENPNNKYLKEYRDIVTGKIK